MVKFDITVTLVFTQNSFQIIRSLDSFGPKILSYEVTISYQLRNKTLKTGISKFDPNSEIMILQNNNKNHNIIKHNSDKVGFYSQNCNSKLAILSLMMSEKNY